MNLVRILKCVLICLCTLHYFAVEAEPKDITSHGKMLAKPHVTHAQESQQLLSEFSEDITEGHKPRKKKGRKKKRKMAQNEVVVKKGKKKLKKKNARRMVKVIKGDKDKISISNKKGIVDIIVHIKMNE